MNLSDILHGGIFCHGGIHHGIVILYLPVDEEEDIEQQERSDECQDISLCKRLTQWGVDIEHLIEITRDDPGQEH